MRYRARYITLVAFVFALAACGGGVAPIADGPLKLGIIAGDNQIAEAGTPQFDDAVVGRMVREQTADGRWRLHFEIVKTAHAQTTVTGSPVPGAVVCSATVEGSMSAFAVCTNTNANGEAVFFYEPGTEAGPQRAEIRGTLDNLPAVFDTVNATVEVAALDRSFRKDSGNRPKPAVVDADAVRDIYGNPYPFRIVSDSLLTVSGDTVGTVAARTVTWTTPTGQPKANRVARVVGTDGADVARLDYTLYVDGTIEWHMLGLDR